MIALDAMPRYPDGCKESILCISEVHGSEVFLSIAEFQLKEFKCKL